MLVSLFQSSTLTSENICPKVNMSPILLAIWTLIPQGITRVTIKLPGVLGRDFLKIKIAGRIWMFEVRRKQAAAQRPRWSNWERSWKNSKLNKLPRNRLDLHKEAYLSSCASYWGVFSPIALPVLNRTSHLNLFPSTQPTLSTFNRIQGVHTWSHGAKWSTW